MEQVGLLSSLCLGLGLLSSAFKQVEIVVSVHELSKYSKSDIRNTKLIKYNINKKKINKRENPNLRLGSNHKHIRLDT